MSKSLDSGLKLHSLPLLVAKRAMKESGLAGHDSNSTKMPRFTNLDHTPCCGGPSVITAFIAIHGALCRRCKPSKANTERTTSEVREKEIEMDGGEVK